MGALRYAGPFAFLASVPVLFAVSPAGPLLAPACILLTLFLAENSGCLLPEEKPSEAFRLLPALYIPLQLLVIAWAAREAAEPVSSLGFLSLALAIGACTGVFGVLAAHELIHSRARWQRWLGAALLTGMTYRHFRIAHVYGHHRLAATERDPSTARLGESFYAFLPRTLWAQVVLAWEWETRRCQKHGFPFWHNALARDLMLTSVLYGALFAIWGGGAAMFLAAQSAIAIIVLELFNYVAHYGLSRRNSSGRSERLADFHSWNSPGWGNLLLFNMGHHSQHHRAPSISYERLKAASGPALPYGYSGSIVLALIPPLWRATMDGRAREITGQPRAIEYTAAVNAVSASL